MQEWFESSFVDTFSLSIYSIMGNAVLVEDSVVPNYIISLNAHKFSIGRGLDNSLVVEDINISRRHSILKFESNEWYIYDMSSNGTWVNESLIDKQEPHKLSDGDIIKLSHTHKYIFKMRPQVDSSRTHLSEEEIVMAAEEVIASVEAFNSEFHSDCSQASITCIPQNIGNVVSTVCSVPPVISEQTIAIQPVIASESIPIAQSVVTAIIEPCISMSNHSQQPGPSSMSSKYNIHFAEDELQCSICTEMFVKAVTLTCSHTFCSYCIAQWQASPSQDCPICRTIIKTKCPTKILDNYIEKITEAASDEFKKHRQEIIAQRKTSESLQHPSTSSGMATAPAALAPIAISSEEEDAEFEGDDYDEFDMSDDSDWSDVDSYESMHAEVDNEEEEHNEEENNDHNSEDNDENQEDWPSFDGDDYESNQEADYEEEENDEANNDYNTVDNDANSEYTEYELDQVGYEEEENNQENSNYNAEYYDGNSEGNNDNDEDMWDGDEYDADEETDYEEEYYESNVDIADDGTYDFPDDWDEYVPHDDADYDGYEDNYSVLYYDD